MKFDRTVLSCARQGSVLGPLLFDVFINDLRVIINYSTYILFADAIRIYLSIKSSKDCNLLQSGINFIQDRCTANCMKFNMNKTKVTTLYKN
jgi:hypothetical protein